MVTEGTRRVGPDATRWLTSWGNELATINPRWLMGLSTILWDATRRLKTW